MSVQSQFSATRVITGPGVIASVGSEAKGLGMSVVMLLIDPFFADTPAGNAIQATLSAAGPSSMATLRSAASPRMPTPVPVKAIR